MKKQNGVTMIELVMVLVILIIITTFSVYTGKSALNQAIVTEVYSEMKTIKEAVNGIILTEGLDEDFEVEAKKHYDLKISELVANVDEFKNMYNVEIPEEEFEDFYVIVGMDDLDAYKNSEVKDTYGLDSIKHSYIVNFKRGEVALLKTIIIDDRSVRTFDQVRNLVDNAEL